MCGIAGALVLPGSDFTVTEPYLTRMRDSMAHRGPDGAGTWTSPDGRMGMAHRRLAVIDLSPEAGQPMHDASGRLTIVYNGEIYNHRELRHELEEAGHRRWLTDHSDTEVILNAFREWGIDCLHRFRGMFAFALWDAANRDLWLVRDRIGIKPLYYSRHHGRLTFASEIKALLKDPDSAAAIDEEALYQYLTFLTTPAPLTLFKGVSKLPAGHWLRVREDGEVQIRRWWDVLDHTTPLTNHSADDIAEMLLQELRSAVSYRKVADRPVGVFLSGGIDSGTNAALFAEGEAGSVKTFTVGYEGNNPSYRNENEHARRTADLVGAEHREILLNPDHIIDFIPEMVRFQDEPLADPVCVPVYYVSKLARDHGVVVCQVGEGADELFHGYRSWRPMRLIQSWSDVLAFNPVRRLARASLGLVPGLPERRLEYLDRTARGQPVFLGGATMFTERQKQRLLSPDLYSRLGGLSSWDAVQPAHARFKQAAWEPTTVNWMSYADLTLRLPELLLMRVDKMSMAVSLEARVPFLDHQFVALAMSIPSRLKVQDNVPKAILKRAVRSVLPAEIIDRPKQGFGMPVRDWMWDALMPRLQPDITRFARRSGLVRPAEVERIVESRDHDRTWVLMNLALWWRLHFDR